MHTAEMSGPGTLRWRALHPLIDEDGSCSLIYDLERAAVLEVPEELQLHVAPALETGNPDDDLLSWLVREDLITMEGWAGWGPEGESAAWGMPGSVWTLGTVLRLEGEVHVQIADMTEEAALQALDVAFRQAVGASRVQLHLDWNGAFPGTGLLERIVREACRLAAEAGQEVSFDLTLDAGQVTPAVAPFLSALPLHIRLRCGELQAEGSSLSSKTRRAVLLLWMEDLADRVTLGFTLAGNARLKELLEWARRLGVRHLDAVRVPGGSEEERALALRSYRADLLEAVDEILANLEQRVSSLDFRPLTRAIRRLMQAEPLARFREERPVGWPVADIAFSGLDDGQGMTREWLDFGTEPEDEDGTCCSACWARYLCRNSALLVAEPAAGERTRETCAASKAESEAALRLYHRLAQADPLEVLRVFGESSGLPDELPTPFVTELWNLKPC